MRKPASKAECCPYSAQERDCGWESTIDSPASSVDSQVSYIKEYCLNSSQGRDGRKPVPLLSRLYRCKNSFNGLPIIHNLMRFLTTGSNQECCPYSSQGRDWLGIRPDYDDNSPFKMLTFWTTLSLSIPLGLNFSYTGKSAVWRHCITFSLSIFLTRKFHPAGWIYFQKFLTAK